MSQKMFNWSFFCNKIIWYFLVELVKFFVHVTVGQENKLKFMNFVKKCKDNHPHSEKTLYFFTCKNHEDLIK